MRSRGILSPNVSLVPVVDIRPKASGLLTFPRAATMLLRALMVPSEQVTLQSRSRSPRSPVTNYDAR